MGVKQLVARVRLRLDSLQVSIREPAVISAFVVFIALMLLHNALFWDNWAIHSEVFRGQKFLQFHI